MESHLYRQASISNFPFVYVMGDTVWYFSSGDATAQPPVAPQVAIITKIGEGNIVDLAIVSQDIAQRLHRSGVCLHGDPNLQLTAYRSRGCWSPRPTQAQLQAMGGG